MIVLNENNMKESVNPNDVRRIGEYPQGNARVIIYEHKDLTRKFFQIGNLCFDSRSDIE